MPRRKKAGQTVYVLTTIVEGGENRPVAVTTDEHNANQWVRSGNDNDWIPFELDDLSTTGMGKSQVTQFKPAPKVPSEQAIEQTNASLAQANKDLKEIVQLLQHRLKLHEKMQGKSSSTNPLLEPKV